MASGLVHACKLQGHTSGGNNGRREIPATLRQQPEPEKVDERRTDDFGRLRKPETPH